MKPFFRITAYILILMLPCRLHAQNPADGGAPSPGTDPAPSASATASPAGSLTDASSNSAGGVLPDASSNSAGGSAAPAETLSWGLELRVGLSPVLSLGESAGASSHAIGLNTELSALLPRNPDSPLEFSLALGTGAAAAVPVSAQLAGLSVVQLHGAFRTAYRLSPRLSLELQAGAGLLAHRLVLAADDPEWFMDPLFIARLGLRINPPSRQRAPGYGLIISPAYLLHGGTGSPGQYLALDIQLRFVWR